MDRSDCRDAVDVHGNTLNCPMHAVITSGSMIHRGPKLQVQVEDAVWVEILLV